MHIEEYEEPLLETPNDVFFIRTIQPTAQGPVFTEMLLKNG